MGIEPATEITELPRHLCWDRLRDAPFGRLAVVVNGKPEIFPVNHVVDGGSIVIRTAAGTKLAGAVAGRPVAFEVDGHEAESGAVWSVVVKGRAREVTALEDVIEALRLPLTPWTASSKPHVVRITPDDVTGRAFRI